MIGYIYYFILYRLLMRLMHRYNLHYAPPIYPDGDTMLWCQWCGFKAVVKKGNQYLKEDNNVKIHKSTDNH